MAQSQPAGGHGNAYNIFMLVLTVYSLAVMVLLLLPSDEDTKALLMAYDTVICVVFLVDFAWNLYRAPSKKVFFIDQRGWLDLLGSIPSMGAGSGAGALLRLARLSRLARIGKLMKGKNRKALVEDVLKNRGQYATFITLLAAGMVLSTASLLVLQVESRDPDANIKTGGDALWWGLVTITTVGYGDRFPVTSLGRITGVFVMFAGVGIIGALASILASMLVPPPAEPEADAAPAPATTAGPAPAVTSETGVTGATNDAVLEELGRLRAEIADLRAALAPPGG